MITVYLGDITSYLSKTTKLTHPDAKLITEENCSGLAPGVYYTSVGDLGNLCNLGEVLRNADVIIYAPPPDGKWSDTHRGVSKMKTWTEDYLKVFSFRAEVKNFSVDPPIHKSEFLELVDTRKTDDVQLWVAGCSISHGIGVEPEQKYGHLLAEKLNLPVSFLTQPRTSMSWAADQILRSDIRKDDLVVWGLTSTFRVPWFNNGVIDHLTPRSYEGESGPNRQFVLDYFNTEDALYRSVQALFQVIHYCKKMEANLLLAAFLDDGTMFNYVKDFDNLVMLSDLWGRDPDTMFLDYGVGVLRQHPGVKTHRFYYNEMYQKIKQLEWI
jgi:hypothetical protein